MSIIDEIKDSFRNGTTLTKLIYLNLGVFLLLHAVIAILYISNAEDHVITILSWMAVPANLNTLLVRPWTILTYMFLHKDFFHILFNICWLYWFGKIFLVYLDQKKLLNLYILGGLAGALIFVISYNIFPVLRQQAPEAMALGASAAVMSIVIAIAAYAPNHSIYVIFLGPVKIIWIALISFFLSSIVDFSINTGGKIAHMGGALFGYLFILRYKQGKDITSWFSGIMDFIFSLFKRREKIKVSYKRNGNDIEYNTDKVERQKEIDRILDKISKSGYESLTAQEKEKLFKFGK
jgi:membrane associated rhomboid family serine protease